jgi:hypothetical protein
MIPQVGGAMTQKAETAISDKIHSTQSRDQQKRDARLLHPLNVPRCEGDVRSYLKLLPIIQGSGMRCIDDILGRAQSYVRAIRVSIPPIAPKMPKQGPPITTAEARYTHDRITRKMAVRAAYVYLGMPRSEVNTGTQHKGQI